MKKLTQFLLIALCVLSCEAQPDPVAFTSEALNDTLLNLDDESVSFQSVLESHKGKIILVDVWASWCKDCIVSLPDLKAIQSDYPDVAYVFLSIDRSIKSWKKGIKKYNIEGEHYFMQDGWDSAFSESIDLDWVPRYMIIDTDGSIKVYRAVKLTDERIRANLN
ncbi:TlpA disulfide reductase family protein [Psychroserpens sp.]|uniref:TlpA family protein disulfide reductase n=1 Tax=Psychroserpens sp. TaxID=2020870 RepID=UPI001B270955|nr:TlpA disulfide reductase family protein [Psychroserpens sp.]MBO6607655.1 TlpA family protein disulfide reductase [Psychroserpens sp.]MBO6630838.1 TlpA family protein disulfide reductase [Psychroserpens sp.]MBO6655033.1 TlpA family protein disulfide reductase [Psychroserpens sp.]MBO6683162.1 TlpA family protein disulfide reductase [Psychroserpens sp.]MBO6749659.1 TlpA family protein disulfide reductase [Psychroserpens sp.]